MARTYGRVTLSSENPKITTSGTLIDAVDSPLPKPKYEAAERYGFYDLPKYAGQEAYELTMQVKFEDGGRSVEDDLRALERLAERPEGRDAPPDVKVAGPVPHDTLRWRITGFQEDRSRTVYDADDDRIKFVVAITLQQRVTDTVLSASISSSTTKTAKGIGGTTRVKQGEEDLYDVAQRYYHDSSYAIAVSKANPVKGAPMPLGTHLRQGQTLRMP